jgi:hypothetical protein
MFFKSLSVLCLSCFFVSFLFFPLLFVLSPKKALLVQEGCSQAVGKPKNALLVTSQRSQCRHLQRDAHNKAKECFTTNLDFAIDLKKAPRTKEQDKKKERQKKHTNMRG